MWRRPTAESKTPFVGWKQQWVKEMKEGGETSLGRVGEKHMHSPPILEEDPKLLLESGLENGLS